MKDSFKSNVGFIEKTVSYTFRDKSLLAQAFTRTSYCNEVGCRERVLPQSNEVLEFFGDTVLSCAIITHLLEKKTERYEHGIKTSLNEGDFSNIKSKLSDKKNLSLAIKRMGLEKFLRMGEGDRKLGIMNEPSVMEDLFESIVGAIFIDSEMNMNAVLKAVGAMLDLNEYMAGKPPIQSAKNALQEWCDDKKRRLPHPRYETLKEEGPDHKKEYERACFIGERMVARGRGKNLKLADAAAAENALSVLKSEDEKKNKANSSLQSTTTPTVKEVNKKQNTKGVINKQNPSKKSHAPIDSAELDTAVAYLKKVSTEKKVLSLGYRDLGSSVIDGVSEHKILCDFLDFSTPGVGKDRLEARQRATLLMYRKVKEQSGSKKTRKK